ncbi:ABC transporter ATP-binding protein [Ekhidna sp. MALMAid0563]|uniref:ABC transporter ATP-binding protein n=1 Tax=Ekhidna sp. MALMAid0563 TaxID=3143937 RepID=UPI0032DEE8E4
MNKPIAISAETLIKSFKGTKALNEINLEVIEGEIYGLIGPDGAGKTTLIRILCSLLFPDSGEVKVLGLNPVQDMKALRRKIGYMPGRFSLYHDLSVEENLNLFARLFETSIKENYHLIRDIYQQIEPFKKRKAGALSGGMKQKLALSCAMIHRPDILFLDEPTTGVDPVSRKEFWEMLGKLNRNGLTILVSTPYMDEAAQCSRISLIQKGQFMATGTPAEIINSGSEKYYSIKGDNKYDLLKATRNFKTCQSVYAFGSSLHYTDQKVEFEPSELGRFLNEKGFGDVEIEAIEPGIEDRFMTLMKNG